MGILLALTLLFIVLSVHELGHALSMKRNGVLMDEICIFGFGYKLFQFKVKSVFGDTPITIRAIPLGAFVKPRKFSMDRAISSNSKGYIDILASGISANFLLGAICSIVAYIHAGELITNRAILIILLIAFGLFPKKVGKFYPILGVLFIVFAIVMSGGIVRFVSETGSVISIATDINKHSNSIYNYIDYVGLVSISVALFNCVPLGILDGGKIFIHQLNSVLSNYRKKTTLIFNLVTIIPLLSLIIYSLGKDIFNLIFH